MIDERELTELLHVAAENFAVPADGAERIRAIATAIQPPSARPRWRTHRLAIACAVVILVGGATVAARELSRGGGPSNVASHVAGVARPAPTAGGSGAENAAAAPAAPPIPYPAGGASAGSAGAAGEAAVAGPTSRPLPTQSNIQPLPDAAKVVKTGSVQLEVRSESVGPTMSRLASLASGLGGYVADTKTSEGGDDPTGSVTLRVPVGTFEQLLTQVRAIGAVRSSTTHGQDVTGQYSDIQARLTALTATRDQLLTILHRATAIGDVLAVQDRINDVQTQIDQLQGQQKVLDDQTSMASLSVDVGPKGASPGPPPKPSGIAKAWDDARHGFTSGVEDILAASGAILVVLLALAVLVVVGRFAWVAARRRVL